MRDSSPPKAADPAETAAATLAARVLHRTLAALHAAGNGGATYRALGARVDVPHQHVGEWCQDLSGRTPKLTKVLRMGPSIAPAVLRALAAEVEASSPRAVDLRDAALGVQESAGSLASRVRAALADGHVDAEERQGIEAVLLAAEAEVAAVRAALASAPRRGAP